MLKFNSDKIMIVWGGGKIFLYWIRFQRNDLNFYNFLSELNNIFHVKSFIRFTFFYFKLIDDMRKT